MDLVNTRPSGRLADGRCTVGRFPLGLNGDTRAREWHEPANLFVDFLPIIIFC